MSSSRINRIFSAVGRFFKKIWPALLVLLVGTGLSIVLVKAKPEPEKKEVEELARSVRAVTATTGDVSLTVKSQGTILSKQVIELVPQVSGQITYVSDKFVAGGRFGKGEVILRIDPRDYEYAVISAEARVTESRQRLEQEKAEAALAKSEWEMLGEGEASDLTLRKPQLADARAKVKAAEANLKTAELNLERATIRAPFTGLMTEKTVDLGQFVSPGSKLGKYYSTEILEVRLPLSNRDLGQFDMARLQSGADKLKVTLTGQFANKQNSWNGMIVRSEGVIDTKTRVLYVVAELKGEQLKSLEDGSPASIGQFVSARIEGRSLKKVITLPREVLRQGDRVLVVDENDKLRTRMVKVAEVNRDHVVISEGLKAGDVVCLSQLGLAVDGLLVKVQMEDNQAPAILAVEGASS